MRPQPLSEGQIADALRELPGWRYEAQSLKKTFRCASFREAMSFMVRIGFEAEEREHHPEITNVYGKVDLVLWTHDAGNQVTQLDVELARAIERLAWI
jgi:4a-hydroxytetrahydrobiopterin dehydratase